MASIDVVLGGTTCLLFSHYGVVVLPLIPILLPLDILLFYIFLAAATSLLGASCTDQMGSSLPRALGEHAQGAESSIQHSREEYEYVRTEYGSME